MKNVTVIFKDDHNLTSSHHPEIDFLLCGRPQSLNIRDLVMCRHGTPANGHKMVSITDKVSVLRQFKQCPQHLPLGYCICHCYGTVNQEL